jgi:hypothetical protein
MKQTAVEWLVEQMFINNYINKKQLENANTWLIAEAKEIEKQQIMEANTAGVNQGLYGYKNAEEYYNKTFKNK